MGRRGVKLKVPSSVMGKEHELSVVQHHSVDNTAEAPSQPWQSGWHLVCLGSV